MTKLSVVIPTYERPDDLERCLHSLNPKRQSIEEEFEVLVTDDSSGMESKSLVENRFLSHLGIRGKMDRRAIVMQGLPEPRVNGSFFGR